MYTGMDCQKIDPSGDCLQFEEGEYLHIGLPDPDKFD